METKKAFYSLILFIMLAYFKFKHYFYIHLSSNFLHYILQNQKTFDYFDLN